MPIKFKIYTLGCKVNQCDGNTLASLLKQDGFELVNKNADLAIVNTCAVTKTAIRKNKRMINKARKENPRAKIILLGCWPRVYGDEAKLVGADMIVKGKNNKELIRKMTNDKFPPRPDFGELSRTELGTKAMTDQCQMSKSKNASSLFNSEKSRYFIKIQDGCEQFCSYCIIPYARGKMKSRGEAEVIAEVKQAIKAGYQEFVLCGIHLGLYGKEKELSLRGACNQATKQSLDSRHVREIASLPSVARNDNYLVSLLNKLIAVEGFGRIRLSSIEITEVTDELIKLMAKSKKLCQHLHIPLQSGSNKILKLMNRPYTVKYFKNKIKKIRKAMPNIAITTDVIVGFPGEAEQEFRETLNLIKQIKFSRLHVFPFSAHEKTPAFNMPHQVQKDQIERRAKILRELNNKLVANYQKKFKGKKLEILVERVKGNKIIGKTEYYFDIEVDERKVNLESRNLIGKIIKVKY